MCHHFGFCESTWAVTGHPTLGSQFPICDCTPRTVKGWNRNKVRVADASQCRFSEAWFSDALQTCRRVYLEDSPSYLGRFRPRKGRRHPAYVHISVWSSSYAWPLHTEWHNPSVAMVSSFCLTRLRFSYVQLQNGAILESCAASNLSSFRRSF